MKSTTLCGKILHFVVKHSVLWYNITFLWYNITFLWYNITFCSTFVVYLWYICDIFVVFFAMGVYVYLLVYIYKHLFQTLGPYVIKKYTL